jgi:tetratricopeptide (TPR) repeat protein
MKNWTSILIVLLLGACGQKPELSIEDASQEFCDCFNSQGTGTVDERLSPCLQKIVDKKNKELNDFGIVNPDSVKLKISEFSLDVMLNMTRTCDNYFVAINDLYDKGYPLDTTALNTKAIDELTNRIKTETNKDSVKSLLHKRVHKLIQARQFDLALEDIDSIRTIDNRDYGANLASAYIFNQTGLHDKAIAEIDKAIEISGNEGLQLYLEIAKRKKTFNKAE